MPEPDRYWAYFDEAWKHVLKCKRTGIMEIFEHKPFPALRLFAKTVADAAEAQRGRNMRNSCSGPMVK